MQLTSPTRVAESLEWAREVPTSRGMRTAHETKVRAALWRLTATDVSPDNGLSAPPPVFLRTPSIALLWIAALAALVGLLALSRVRLPHTDRDRAVATSHH